jgi:hypothetical protein
MAAAVLPFLVILSEAKDLASTGQTSRVKHNPARA